jgi:3-methyladenine DNA glycosylase Tag
VDGLDAGAAPLVYKAAMSDLPTFSSIYDRACAHKGGPGPLEELLPVPRARDALLALPDDRALSAMTQGVFSAGFVWKVVENMWPGFEQAFGGFEPPRVAFMSSADIDALALDKRIVRHRGKIAATRDNARMVVEVAADHGSFGRFLAEWPEHDLVGLWTYLKREGSRLGGMTGPYLLRRLGLDTFLITGDVSKALVQAGVVHKKPTGKGALAATQAAFVAWKSESGRSFAELSKVLACSVD